MQLVGNLNTKHIANSEPLTYSLGLGFIPHYRALPCCLTKPFCDITSWHSHSIKSQDKECRIVYSDIRNSCQAMISTVMRVQLKIARILTINALVGYIKGYTDHINNIYGCHMADVCRYKLNRSRHRTHCNLVKYKDSFEWHTCIYSI